MPYGATPLSMPIFFSIIKCPINNWESSSNPKVTMLQSGMRKNIKSYMQFDQLLDKTGFEVCSKCHTVVNCLARNLPPCPTSSPQSWMN